jgi:hypothetical protein
VPVSAGQSVWHQAVVNGCENLRVNGAKGLHAGTIAVAYNPHIVTALSGWLGGRSTEDGVCNIGTPQKS